MLKVGTCTALTAQVLAQLKGADIRTATQFLLADVEQLSQQLCIPYKDLCSIRRVLLAENSAFPISAASLYQRTLSSLMILSTGVERLDDLLDGGLYTGELTELAGDTAAGKTQICLRCAATTVRLEGQSVVYIDTSAAFSPDCLFEMLSEECDNLTPQAETLVESGLRRVRVVSACQLFDLFAALAQLETELRTQNSQVKLVVVDSLPSVVNPVMGGHAGSSQSFLSLIGSKLKQLASQFCLAVLVTNNLTTAFNGSEKKPTLGRAWSHVPQTRVILRKCASHQVPPADSVSFREALLVKSSRQQVGTSVVASLSRRQHGSSQDSRHHIPL